MRQIKIEAAVESGAAIPMTSREPPVLVLKNKVAGIRTPIVVAKECTMVNVEMPHPLKKLFILNTSATITQSIEYVRRYWAAARITALSSVKNPVKTSPHSQQNAQIRQDGMSDRKAPTHMHFLARSYLAAP